MTGSFQQDRERALLRPRHPQHDLFALGYGTGKWRLGLDGAFRQASLFCGVYFHSEIAHSVSYEAAVEAVDALNLNEQQGLTLLFSRLAL